MNKPIYLAIDFETANNKRISACSFGYSLFTVDEELSSGKYLINPPEEEKFSPINTRIHGLRKTDVENALNFKDLWQRHLSSLFKNHVVILHNSSMDLSVLKSCFEYYDIKDFDFLYFDTMSIAKKFDLPQKLDSLSSHLGLYFSSSHNPEEDAVACGRVFSKLAKGGLYISDNAKRLTYEEPKTKSITPKFNPSDNFNVLISYGINDNDILDVDFNGKSIVVTGDLSIDREIAHSFIIERGGVIKSSISTKTDYVIVGQDFGPSKINKVGELNSVKNSNIKIISSKQFDEIFVDNL